ncbi:MAG: ABC transporter substrate-binding protein [Spirochaetales bacterium]|nr:ABC transporter substrate-binding protein [Spirochaetales bacterium]
MKKILIVLLMVSLAVAVFAGGEKEEATPEVKETAPAAPAIKNPGTLVYATYGTVDSLDPSKAYDTASWTNIANIYETLVAFKGESTSEFVPKLCTEIPTVANGGIINDGKTFRFKIRKGVKFHSGNTMTPEDVEYSFERLMVLDPDAGPNWIWYQLFIPDLYGSRDDDGNIVVDFADIDKAVEVDGEYVVFNLLYPAPYFLGVLGGKWAVVVDKKFCIANGDWDGTEAGMAAANNPAAGEEPLYDIASGTGPYKLDRWDKGVELVVTRFDGYWGPKPAIAKGIYKVVDEWSTRKLMLIQGDADIATVDPVYYPDMDKEEATAGITVYKDLPSLSVSGFGFNQAVAAVDNPLIFSGKLDGQGVPPNFFADKNVRLAFQAAWDQDTFINDIMNGYAMDPITPVVKGLPYKRFDLERPPMDLAKSAEYFKKAFGGKLWEVGFQMDLTYNVGNDVRQFGSKLLAENVMKVNPKFKINVRGVEWAEYVNLVRTSSMPMFFIGWAPDYPDPDNYVNPYMHSNGHYAHQCSYSNPEADRLIEEAAVALDPKVREAAYFRLQEIWVEDAPGIMNSQPSSRRYFKNWVKGYYFNPMESSEYDLLPVFTKG